MRESKDILVFEETMLYHRLSNTYVLSMVILHDYLSKLTKHIFLLLIISSQNGFYVDFLT